MNPPTDDKTQEYITDVIFEEIGRRILMIKDIQKKIGVVFQFNIHKKGLPTKTWILDGKSEKPVCYPGMNHIRRLTFWSIVD